MILTRRTCIASLAAAIAAPARAADASATGRLSARPGTPSLPAPEAGTFNRIGDAVLYTPARFKPAAAMPLLVTLHGSGASALSIAREVAPAADARGLLLLAPKSRASTWDLRHAPACDDAAGIDKALAQVFAMTTVGRMAVAGVSDGASFALSLGIANGDLFSDVISFSAGYLRIGPVVGRPRIFLSHGRRDRIIPFRIGQRIADTLGGAGMDVTFRPFDGGHEIPKDGLDAALDRFLE